MTNKSSFILINLLGLAKVWGVIWSNARYDLDLIRLWCFASLPFIFRAQGNPDIFILKGSLRTALMEKCQWWQWLLLIGSSCLVVFIHPLAHNYRRREGQRWSAVLYWAPGGSVVQALFYPVLYWGTGNTQEPLWSQYSKACKHCSELHFIRLVFQT